MSSSSYTVISFKEADIGRIIHSLARMRTLAMKCSEINEHYDNIFYVPVIQQLEPSSLGVGENIEGNPLIFQRWVREEEAALTRTFKNVCTRSAGNPDDIIRWLCNAKRSCRQYAQTYQSKIDDVNRTNATMAKALFFSLATAAITECAAELALIGYGLLGGIAKMTFQLAAKKVIVGAGSGIMINLADNWTHGGLADMLICTQADNVKGTGINMPGFFSDAFSSFLPVISNNAMSSAMQQVKKTRPNLGFKHGMRVARVNAGVNLAPARGAAGALTFVGYAMAIWATKLSLEKLGERLTTN